MSNKILYNINGSVGIVSIAEGYSIEDCIELLPKGCTYCIFSEEQINNTEYFDDFFEAIVLENSQIQFNIVKAQEITKQRLRKERAPMFESVDLDIRDAMISNDMEKLKKAVAERDRLRDITLIVDNVNELSELVAVHI